jgi:chemotaxis protein methyltransferase CheR
MSLALDEQSFKRVCQLLDQHAGIDLNPSKRQMASNRIRKPMQSLGMSSPEDYLNLVARDPQQLQGFINALTTNVSAFNREAHHFPVLVSHLANKVESAKLWSAGCSNGQEPYSMLIALAEAFPGLIAQRKTSLILATDVDTAVLSHAKEGIYEREVLKPLSAAQIGRYFDFQGDDQYQVKASLRKLIDFRPYNLARPNTAPAWSGLDAIFCRNVMIYFKAGTQRQLAETFAKVLKPDALLFTGHSEMLIHSDQLFQSLGQTVFRLRGQP